MNGRDTPSYYAVYWLNCYTGLWVLQTDPSIGKQLSFKHTWSSTGLTSWSATFPAGTYQ